MLLPTHALVGMALSLPVAVAAPELAPIVFFGDHLDLCRTA